MTKPSIVLVPASLCLAGSLFLIGCDLVADNTAGPSGTNVVKSDDGIDEYYDRYKGPLKSGRTAKAIEQITFTQQGGDYDPAVSPDGQKLIFSSTMHSPVPDIYMKNVVGSTVTRLTTTPCAEIQPCFSPDGKQFAYASNRRGKWDICIESVEGAGNPNILTQSMKSDAISPCWHPNGEWIAFSSFDLRNSQWELAVKNVKTGRIKLLREEGLYPRFSPDGKRLAYQRAREREPRWFSIWVIDLNEDFDIVGAPTLVVDSAKWAAINPCWSPDGNYLAFATVHESPIAQGTRRILMGDDIWVVNVRGQDLVRLTDSPEPESRPVWAKGKDGKGRIYFCSMQAGPKNIWMLTEPRLPEPFGSVAGPLPGPAPESSPRRVEPPTEKPAAPATPETPRKPEAGKLPELPPPATAQPE